MFGNHPYRSSDHSGNIRLLALVSFGDSWHNSHHAAFPSMPGTGATVINSIPPPPFCVASSVWDGPPMSVGPNPSDWHEGWHSDCSRAVLILPHRPRGYPLTKSRTTSGKRQRQQQQREKAQAKVERKAARQASEPEGLTQPVESSELELMEELAVLHRSIEAGHITYQEFEERREHIRQQLEHLDQPE